MKSWDDACVQSSHEALVHLLLANFCVFETFFKIFKYQLLLKYNGNSSIERKKTYLLEIVAN